MGFGEFVRRVSSLPPSTEDNESSSSSHLGQKSPGSGSTPRSGGGSRLRMRMFSGQGRSTDMSDASPARLSSQSSGSGAGSDALKKKSSSTVNDENNPGHPLFSVQSNHTERGLAALRNALNSITSKDANKEEPEDSQLRNLPSLVPPNYKNAFEMREFAYTTNFLRAQWAEELVAVPDNGMREELRDMYSIFADMEQRPTMLTGDDVTIFVEWFGTFLECIEELFYLEEQCLYAWIEGTDLLLAENRKWGTSTGRVKGTLSEAKRIRLKGDILRVGNDISVCVKLFERRPIAEVLPTLAAVVTRFVDQLVTYLDLKKDLLPPIIHKYLHQKDRARFERSYWDTARTLRHHECTIVLATRWMDRKQIRRWKGKYFGPRKGLYGKWKTLFLDNHYAVVTEFAGRVLTSEKERLKQMEDNRAARAMMQQAIHALPNAQEYTDSEAPSGLSSSCASSVQRSNMSSVLVPLPGLV